MDLFIFGNCSASYLALGITSLIKTGEAERIGKVAYWAMPAKLFSLEESWHFEPESATITNCHMNKKRPTRDIFHHGIDNKIDAWIHLPPQIKLPLPDFNPVYIYSSPIFPYKRLLDICACYDQYCPSDTLIKAMALEEIKYSLKLVKVLSKLGKEVVVPEAPRRFKIELNPQVYKDVSELWETTIKDSLRKAGAMVVDLDKDRYCDEEGFTREEYRKWAGDALHANLDYSLLVSKDLLGFLSCA